MTAPHATVLAAQSSAARKVAVTRYLQIALSMIMVAVVVAIVLMTKRMTFALNQTVVRLAATSADISTTVDMHERIAADQAAAMTETTITMEQLGRSSQVTATQAHAGA